MRLPKRSREGEPQEQQSVTFKDSIKFSFKNHACCRKVENRTPFFRLCIGYQDGTFEFFYFCVRNGGLTNHEKNYEDLSHYIGDVKDGKEASERFNEKYGFTAVNSAIAEISAEDIANLLLFDEESDMEALPLNTNQDDTKVFSPDSTFPPGELGWDLHKNNGEHSFFDSISSNDCFAMKKSPLGSESNTNQEIEPDSSQENISSKNLEDQFLGGDLYTFGISLSSFLIEQNHWKEYQPIKKQKHQ